MVLDSYYPPDIRVEKEVDALLQAGFCIDLLCYRKKGQSQREELSKGQFRIIRTSIAVGHALLGILDIANSIFFRKFIIQSELNKLENPEKYIAAHAHDLPVSKTVQVWTKKHNISFLLDLHENYPEALGIWFSWRKSHLVKLKNKLFFNYSKWIKREKEMVRIADHNIAVVDEMKNRLVELHGIDRNMITVVSNTEPKNRNELRGVEATEGTSKDITYVGGIGPHRGLDTAIRAMPEILASDPEFRLVIVGSGSEDNMDYLKNLLSSLGLQGSVVFVGRVPLKRALQYMHEAFLNIIPHVDNDHTNNTVPHKLFQIMNSGFPLMVSSSKPLKRIVESVGCGLVFESGNAESFAERVKWALMHKSELKEMAGNGREAVQMGPWNWEHDSQKLVGLYKSLKEFD